MKDTFLRTPSLMTVVSLCIVLYCSPLWGACSTSQLTTEFGQDPAGLGYQPHITAGQDQQVANIINLPRATPEYQVNRGIVSTQLLLQEMVIADLLTLLSGSPSKFPILQLYMGVDQIDTSDPEVQGVMTNLFPVGTQSRTNLVAFFKKQGSRADILCGGSVPLAQVSEALTPLRP